MKDIEKVLIYQLATISDKYSKLLNIVRKLNLDIYENGGGDSWNWFIDTNESIKVNEDEAQFLKSILKNSIYEDLYNSLIVAIKEESDYD